MRLRTTLRDDVMNFVRGFVPLEETNTTESVSRKVLYSTYRPFVFDIQKGQWKCLSRYYDELYTSMTGDTDPVRQFEIESAKRTMFCFDFDLPYVQTCDQI